MDALHRPALPWYCRKCGTEHDSSRKILQCKNAACRARDAFTLSISDVEWAKLLTPTDRLFLTALFLGKDY